MVSNLFRLLKYGMRRRSVAGFGSVAAVVALAAIAQPSWLTHRNTEFSYRFIYPPDWRVVTPRGPNVRYSINNPSGTPLANCNVVVRRLPAIAGYTQRQLNDELSVPYSTKDWSELMGDKFPDMRIVERRNARADNRPAQYAVLEYSYETVDMKIYARGMNVVTFSPGVFWHFSCSGMGATLAEAQRSYTHWVNVFGRIISSLVFEQ